MNKPLLVLLVSILTACGGGSTEDKSSFAPTTDPQKKPLSEPVSRPEPAPLPDPDPVPLPEPEPAPLPEPVSQPEPVAQPDPEPVSQPVPDPPDPDPVPEPLDITGIYRFETRDLRKNCEGGYGAILPPFVVPYIEVDSVVRIDNLINQRVLGSISTIYDPKFSIDNGKFELVQTVDSFVDAWSHGSMFTNKYTHRFEIIGEFDRDSWSGSFVDRIKSDDINCRYRSKFKGKKLNNFPNITPNDIHSGGAYTFEAPKLKATCDDGIERTMPPTGVVINVRIPKLDKDGSASDYECNDMKFDTQDKVFNTYEYDADPGQFDRNVYCEGSIEDSEIDYREEAYVYSSNNLWVNSPREDKERSYKWTDQSIKARLYENGIAGLYAIYDYNEGVGCDYSAQFYGYR